MIAAALAFFCASACAAAAGPLQLKYVVIVSRHGVRSPEWDADQLNQYSVQPWPDWGVGLANLTPHGRELMVDMGAYYRAWLASKGLLDPSGCGGGHVYIWADRNQRTMESARALAEGFGKDCGIDVHAVDRGQTDPLFHPAAPETSDADETTTPPTPVERVSAIPIRPAFDALQHVLKGDSGTPKTPLVWEDHISVRVNGASIEMNTSLPVTSILAQDLLLEYANGFSGDSLGWGRLNAQNLRQILDLHALYAELTMRRLGVARFQGSNFLAHVLDSMTAAVTGKAAPNSIGDPADAALILSGHDTNIQNIAGMLGLTWKLADYPADETPPGSALIFSLWREASGAYVVKTQFVTQTPDQLHDATPLSLAAPPETVDVALPGCKASQTADGCPWPAFQQALLGAIDPDLVQSSGARQ